MGVGEPFYARWFPSRDGYLEIRYEPKGNCIAEFLFHIITVVGNYSQRGADVELMCDQQRAAVSR